MKNNIKTISILLISILFLQCTSENQFLIKKNSVGKINNKHIVSDIKTLFSNDSVVVRLSEGDIGGEYSGYLQEDDQYLIYSKDGKHLLSIVPKTQHDATSKIKYVEIIDGSFKTEKEISFRSPFKDIVFHYMVDKVETSFSSATLYIDELNATIAMRKSDIGVNPFEAKKINLKQIPDMAKMNHFTIWFD